MRGTCKFLLVLSLTVVGSLLSARLAGAATSIEFLSPSSMWTTGDKNADFRLKANQAPLQQTSCRISDFKDDAGHPINKALFPCKVPNPLLADAISDLVLDMTNGSLLPPGTYSLTLDVLGMDSSGATFDQSTSFRYVVPAVTLKIGDTDGLRIPVVRKAPWEDAVAWSQISPVVTSIADPTKVPTAPPMQLYVQDGDAKNLIQGIGGTATFICDGNSACNQATSRGGVWPTGCFSCISRYLPGYKR